MLIPAACEGVTEEAVRLELDRVLKSRIFSQSLRLCRFLQFTVQQTLAGKADTLKEYLIGCEVYDRRPDYDPTVDSIVRTEAHRLRAKLRQYYDTDGRRHMLRIHFDTGRYVPTFIQPPLPDDMELLPRRIERTLQAADERYSAGLRPSCDPGETALSTTFARELSEEIAQVLMRRGMSSLAAPGSRHLPASRSTETPLSWYPDFRLEGSVREADGGLSVMVKLIFTDRIQAA